jgi:hypothetical protein
MDIRIKYKATSILDDKNKKWRNILRLKWLGSINTKKKSTGSAKGVYCQSYIG